MIGIDTNVLIAVVSKEHVLHTRTSTALDRHLQSGERYALTPNVISEFLHVITDARRIVRPLSMVDALEYADTWWTADECVQVFPTPESTRLGLGWMSRFQLGRKRILDTQLAATLYTAGVQRLLTLNPDDFRAFGMFELLVP